MAKYEQGAAPAVMFENEEVLFAFREGKLELKDEKVREHGGSLHDKLIAVGAICIEDGRLMTDILPSPSRVESEEVDTATDRLDSFSGEGLTSCQYPSTASEQG